MMERRERIVNTFDERMSEVEQKKWCILIVAGEYAYLTFSVSLESESS